MLLLLSCCFAITGCDVHEFPDPPERVPFVLHLSFKTNLPIHEEISYTRHPENSAEKHDMRYIINAYRSANGEDFSRRADTTIVYTRHVDEEKDHSIWLNLPQGFYKFIAWSDYVEKGTTTDKYYNTSNFAEIVYSDLENYVGCNDFKDVFRGETIAAIPYDQYSDGNVITQEATIPCERPLAKFKFISTDLNEFMDQVLANAASKGKTTSRTINPDDYRVVFKYEGFMPHSFHMFDNKPNDALPGIFFEGDMVPIDDSEIQLGFDYVFVNGRETNTKVSVEVYDKDGVLLSKSGAVTVPLVRSKLTIVRGEFLTSKATGSMGIDPDYSGDFDIYVE